MTEELGEQGCAMVGNAQGETSVLTKKTDEQVQKNGVIKNAQEENTIVIEKTEEKLQEIAVIQNCQGDNIILAEKTERPQECPIAENTHENNAVILKTGQQVQIQSLALSLNFAQFRISPPGHTMSHFVGSTPLMCDVIYGWSLSDVLCYKPVPISPLNSTFFPVV